MPVEANYYPHTKDGSVPQKEGNGWLRPADFGFQGNATYKLEYAVIGLCPFVVEDETSFDAIALKQKDTKNQKYKNAIYRSNEYGFPKKLYTKFDGKSWEPNKDRETPRQEQIFKFDDVVTLKTGLYWVASMNIDLNTSTYDMVGYRGTSDILGINAPGDEFYILKYSLNEEWRNPDLFFDEDKDEWVLKLIDFPPELTSENGDFVYEKGNYNSNISANGMFASMRVTKLKKDK